MHTSRARQLTRWLALFSVLAATPSAALAESLVEEEPADDGKEGDVTRYAFDDDLVRGGAPAPDGEVLHVRRRRDRESLIRIRDQFIPELLKSAEDL
jgi:hypothetical protein